VDWLRKHKNIILIIVIAGFIISTFVGFGLYIRSGAASVETVAEVNDEKIPYRRFIGLYNQVINRKRDKGEDLGPEVLKQAKQDVIQSLIQESVFYQEAKRYGIDVTDTELAQSLYSIPAFQKEGKFSVQSYAQTLQFGLRTTPEEFEETQRKQLAISRLRALITQEIKITDKELEMELALRRQDPNYKKSPVKDKEEMRRQMREEKGAHILNRWYQQLGTNIKVKVYLDEIERRGQG
jgi:peptidyl-prolyl cis-trans isomerase D